MKLLIILAVIAHSYADKLDRTYLPPASAATAGGSPGSIAAPGTDSEFGLPKDTSPFKQPSNQPFGRPTLSSSVSQTPDFTFGQESKPIGSQSRPQFGQPGTGSTGSQTGPQSGSPQFGQPGSNSANSQSGSPQFGQSGVSPVGSQFQQTGPQSGLPQFGQPGSGPTGSQGGPQSGSQQIGPPESASSGSQTGPQSGSPQIGQPGSGPFGSQTGPESGSPQFVQPGSGPYGSQNGPQSGLSQFGQPGSGPSGSQTGLQSGLPQFGQPGSGPFGSQTGPQSATPQFGQPGSGPSGPQTGPQSELPQFGQPGSGPLGSPQFGKPGSLPFGSQTRPQSASPQFGQPESGSSSSQSGPQFGSPQLGQPGSGPFGSQTHPQSGSSQIGQPGSGPFGSQTGPQSESPQFGQPGTGPLGSQYNSGRPGFGQTNTGINQSPAFGGQSQGFPAYPRPSLPERTRASFDRNAEILHYQNDIDGDSFAYSFETSNGIAADEAGVATHGVRAKGGFSYTGDDGQVYSVRYTADENGYIPQGDHLPTPHPIPEEILKSLEENAKAAAAGTQEGAYNPEEDSDNGASYPGFGQPGRESDRYNAGQNPNSQYGFPGTSAGTLRPQGSPGSDAKYGTSPRPPVGPGAGTTPYGTSELSPSGSSQLGSSRFPPAGNQVPRPQYGGLGASSSNLRPGSAPGQSPSSQYNNFLAPISGSSGNPKLPAFGTQNIGGKPYGVNNGEPSQGSSLKPGSTSSPQYGTANLPSPGTGRPSVDGLPSQGIGATYPDGVSSFGYPSGRPGLPQQTNQSPPSQFSNQVRPLVGSNEPTGAESFPSQNGQNSRPQFGRPSGLPVNTGLSRPGISSLGSKYQPNTISSYPSGPAKPLSPGFPSQDLSPSSQYKMPFGSSPNTDRPIGSNTGSNRDSSSPVSQYSPRPSSGINSSTRPQFPSQNYLNSGYQYNTPGGVSSDTRPGSQRPSSQIGTSPSSQYGTTAPSSSNTMSGPTDFSSGSPTGSISPAASGTSQYPTGVSPSGIPSSSVQRLPSQGNLSPGTLSSNALIKPQRFPSGKPTESEETYGSHPANVPNGIGSLRPTEPQNSPIISSQSSPTQIPTISPVGGGKQPGYYQRPQFGSTAPSRPIGSNILGPKGQATQDQDESGYKYSRPQTVSGSGSSPLIGQANNFNNNLPQRPSTLTSSSTNLAPNASGFPKFPGFANQRYPSNLRPSSLTPESTSQRFPFSRPGQYTPGNINSRPAVGSLGTSPTTNQLGSNPYKLDSAPYQYNRPGAPITSSNLPSFGSLGLKRPGQTGSLPKEMPVFGTSGQEKPGRPGQSGLLTGINPLGQRRPGQSGSRPSFSPLGQEPGLTVQGKPGSGISQPGVSSSGQENPLQESYRPGFERPGKVDSPPGYDLPDQKRPSQFGSPSNSGPSGQDRPDQDNTQSGHDIPSLDRPVQTGPFGQKTPGQEGSQNVFEPFRQDRPDQTGSRPAQNGPGQRFQEKLKEDFSGPRQPPSFSKEEGYKY